MVSSRVNIIKISIENGQKIPINNYYCHNAVGISTITEIRQQCQNAGRISKNFEILSAIRHWRNSDGEILIVEIPENRPGNRLDQLNYPTYIFVDREQSVYVSDRYNHRVMKRKLGAKEGIIVAGNQTEGNSLKQLSCPTGIVVDQLGAVYVADSNNHRVMRWSKEAVQGSIVVDGNGHG